MIITIQGIPERAKTIKRLKAQIVDQLNIIPHIHLDSERISCFSAFRDMLREYRIDDYRLHFQDDVILSENFAEPLTEALEHMKINEMDLLSLFVPNRKKFQSDYDKGIKYAKFPNFLWLQAVIFSPRLLYLLSVEAENYEDKDDDVFVAHVLSKYKIKAFAHLPSLVQHDIKVRSSLGHANNSQRQSKIFIDDKK